MTKSQDTPRPTAAELDLLQVLWPLGSATARQVHQEYLKQRTDVTYATVLRLMQIMHTKGLLVRDERERSHVYAPAQAKDSLQVNLLKDLVQRAFAGSAEASRAKCGCGSSITWPVRVETVLFYHPAVWWISGRIGIEREQVADDLAARQLGEPRRLALALSELERFQFSTHRLAQAANGGDLMLRIKRLVRPDAQGLSWKAALPVLGLAAICMAMYANAAPAQPEPAGKTVSTKAVLELGQCEKPLWPARALAAQDTGAVTVSFRLTADGTVADSIIAKSSGFADLDEATRAAFTKCTFKPATKAGKPMPETIEIVYVWELK